MVTPPHEQPYQLTVYLLDFDRNGRAIEAIVEDDFGTFVDRQKATVEETARGVYLTWTVTGAVTMTLRKLAGFNVVASGVFIDSPPTAPRNACRHQDGVQFVKWTNPNRMLQSAPHACGLPTMSIVPSLTATPANDVR